MIKAIFLSATEDTAPTAAEYRLGPNVVLLLVQDGTARLLDMDGHFYAMTVVGAKMLRETLERGTAATVQSIAAQYGVDAQQVRTDVGVFLRELQRQRLLYSAESRRRTRSPKATVASLILAPALRFTHCGAHSLQAKVWRLLTLARLSFRLFGWSHTIAAWQRYHGQVPEHTPVQDREGVVRTVDETVRAIAAGHVFDMGCKERSLCCWTLLRSAGVPATVVLGVNLFPLASHCWCESDPWILSDYQDHCEKFVPVLRYE
jgi:hypothetical protein